jgi:hypothetical protein
VEKDMNWQDKVGSKLDTLGTYLVGGFHAMPKEDKETPWIKKLPSQHRLYNAAGMFAFFMIGGYLRDTMRGFDEKGVTVEREDVIAPLRFLHGVLAHNPHSDKMQDRWNKVICQIIPATFGATGAIMGSVFFFRNNVKRDPRAARLQYHANEGTGDGLGAFQADDAIAHHQSWPFRALAGVFATFSAASGLTVLYGMFLNSAFSFASNRKMFAGLAELTGIEAFRKGTNTSGNTQFGPVDALDRRFIQESKNFFERHQRSGKKEVSHEDIKEFQDRMMKEVIQPLFPDYASKPENQKKLRDGVTKMFNDAIAHAQKDGTKPEDVSKNAMGFIKSLFAERIMDGDKLKELKYRGTERFITTLHQYFGMSQKEMEKADLSNNGLLGSFAHLLMKPFGSDKMVQDFSNAWVKKVGVVFDKISGQAGKS